MNRKVTGLFLMILLGAGVCAAQNAPAPATPPMQGQEKAQNPPAPAVAPMEDFGKGDNIPRADFSSVYCSMFFTDKRVPNKMYVVSGEESADRIVYAVRDYIYLNLKAAGEVKVGDEFSVVRPITEPYTGEWFKWQKHLLSVMGLPYANVGRVKVVDLRSKLAIAQITLSCEPMQRGDILQRLAERPIPEIKDASTFDRFSPDNSKLWKKKHAMVVSTDTYMTTAGRNSVIYVNLGSGQGVKFGDYFRIFRYQGSRIETVSQSLPKDYQYTLFGFGTAEKPYSWNNIPRQVVGEGVVLNLSKNSSTVLVTYSWTSISAGDYVELE